jgi:ubiquitin-conjugating enzyme E2 variant
MDSPDQAQVMQTAIDDKKTKTAVLASKYTRSKRIFEITCVCTAATLFVVSLLRICNAFFFQNIWIFLCACVLSMYLADFFSGIVHWAADTWGSLDTPVLGGSIIRSFREHHLEPTAICKHDVFEVNGDNLMLTVPFLFLTACLPPKENDVYFLFVHNFLVLVCFWVGITNQIHKWTHTYRLSKFVKLLMDMGIVLSKKDHAVHHRNPFDKYYCITTGWLNPVLANIAFWKRLEGVVSYITGATAREDDMLWTGVAAKTE